MTLSPTQLARLPEALFEIGKAIGSDHDPSIMLARVSQLVCELTGAETCSIMLLDSEGQTLSAHAAYGLGRASLQQEFRVGEGVAGWVVQHGIAAHIPDVKEDDRFVVRSGAPSVRSMLCVPLATRGEVIGTLTATSRDAGAFAATEVDLLNFIAMTIALDVQNIRLHRVSVTDSLTGAYNREFLQKKLRAELEAASQRSCPISLAMVDVDHFKRINDQHGHQVGDTVLTEVAQRLRAVIRTNDWLIRYGGEEFLVMLPNADAGRAWEVGERMRTIMERTPIEAEGPKQVHVSVGIAQFKPPEREHQLVDRADKALYAAKSRGRNRVEVG